MICSSLPLHVFPDSFLACFLPLFSMHLGFFPVHLTSIYQTFSIHFHSPFPSFPHTSLTGVDSTPCIDCIIRSNVRHGCSIDAPGGNPFSIHSINAFSRNFPSIVHTFSIHPLSLHFPHFVHQRPFISINFASFLSILFPAHSIQPFPMNCLLAFLSLFVPAVRFFTFCPCIFLHLGFCVQFL